MVVGSAGGADSGVDVGGGGVGDLGEFFAARWVGDCEVGAFGWRRPGCC